MNHSCQSITLTENQLDALAKHLEHIVDIIRQRISKYPEQPVLLGGMEAIESALESTEALVRAIQQTPSAMIEDEIGCGTERRAGRRRRSRRR